MRFSQNFLFLAPNRSHLPVAWYTRLRIGAIFRLWHQNWCHFRERDFRCGIKIDAIFGSGISAVALKLMPFLITSSLIPSGKGHFLSSFQKNIRSLNPRLEVVLSTYPARISPIIPYSNFCGWKTTRFMKKFPTPLYRNFRSKKTKHFSNLFQKMFSPLHRRFLSQKRTHFFKKASCSYTASFFGRI